MKRKMKLIFGEGQRHERHRGVKSLKDISWKCSEEEYRADKALSYSTLARYHREGFDNLEHLFDRTESPSLLFGSIVDCLMTGNPDEFNSRFLVADFPELPDSQRKMIDCLYGVWKDTCPSIASIPDNAIIAMSMTLQFQMNWKPETRARVIKENGGEYYDLLTLAEGRTVISQRLYDDALACVDVLRTSEATRFYFETDNPFDSSIERLYQLKFRGKYEGVDLRCMADLILVDHKNRIVYPCDLKTSYKPEWRFYRSFVEWCYWIQAQLYWYIIRQCMDADEYFRDFRLADYRFIVVSNRTRRPLVWEFQYTTAATDLEIGEHALRNWRGIALELNGYLQEAHDVPVGISTVKPNNITEWLENE